MSATPTWEALREEYHSLTVGSLWMGEIDRAVRLAASKYPPAIYSETGEWDTAAFENLAQEVVVTQLLGEGQIDYILAVATHLAAARALLNRNVRRTLARGRRRTVVDNILERIESISPFADPGHDGPPATDEALHDAASQLRKLPRIRVLNSDRAPTIYTAESLGAAARIVGECLGPNVRRSEMSRILELVLSDYVPGALVHFEGGLDEPDRAFTPDQEFTVTEVLAQLTGLPGDTLAILALKVADHSDSVVAGHFNISRPTAAKQFKRASADVGAAIGELESTLQDEVLARFADKLLADHLPNDLPGGAQ